MKVSIAENGEQVDRGKICHLNSLKSNGVGVGFLALLFYEKEKEKHTNKIDSLILTALSKELDVM